MPACTSRVGRIKISATKLMPMLAAQVGGCVSLGQGVPSFTPPDHVLQAVCAALGQRPEVHRYSLQPGMAELRAAIAAQIARERGWSVDPESQIGVTAGAMEALLCAVLSLVEDGDEVLVPAPYYPSHVEQILMAGGRPVFVPLDPATYALDVPALERAITPRTKALLLCSPANPTGAVYAEAQVRAAGHLAVERDLWILTDETYDVLTYTGQRAFSLTQVAEVRDRLVAVFSFSKRYALTGWRVGYAVAPATLMAEMLKIHDCATICAPSPSQVAALAALSGPQEPFATFVPQLQARRDLMCARLDALGGAFSYVRPQGAFYVMARYAFSHAPSQEVAERLVREARVITIPGGAFGPGGEGCLRLSFGGSESEINEAFDRITRWLGR